MNVQAAAERLRRILYNGGKESDAEHDETPVSNNTQALIDLLRQRDAKGLVKYGVSLDRTDLTQEQWIQHTIEELLDAAAYLEGLKRTLANREPQA